ncbi:MAG TPA: GNAT family N-acetyltransferase [Actinoplanes sp.]|nr:GNAT family N-acetyltransferase [Actinoplanes sp.]
MPTTIRRATPDDAAELHDVAARTFALACPPGTRQADIDAFIEQHLSPARFEEYLKDERRVLLLAWRDGVPIGYSMLVGGPVADEDVRRVVDPDTTIELSKFYVLESSHGTGAAHDLMAATLAAAAETGAATCWLGVNQQNVRAAKFYDKSGFTVRGTKRFLVGDDWHDDHVRVRSLP